MIFIKLTGELKLFFRFRNSPDNGSSEWSCNYGLPGHPRRLAGLLHHIVNEKTLSIKDSNTNNHIDANAEELSSITNDGEFRVFHIEYTSTERKP